MTDTEIRSFRLNSTDEPTDEMLNAIMAGVQEHAIESSIKAKAELDRRFNALVEQMMIFKASLKRKEINA